MTYDRDNEIVKHAEITQKTGTANYCADPYNPWRRGSDKSINGLIRQYLVKGTDLSVYSQQGLDETADSLNTRPSKTLGRRSLLKVYTKILKKPAVGPLTLQ